MTQRPDNRAWLLMLPAMSVLGIVGLVPLIAVFNYAFFDIFTLQSRFWVGTEWFAELVGTPDLYAALGRSLLFSTLVVLVQFPLGIAIALMIPRGRLAGSLVLMLVAIPLVVPWNLIPMIWLNLLHPTYGTVAQMFDAIGFDFDYKFNAVHTYALLVTVDTWHWIGLVVILTYSGLSAIPPSYYQAARIDGASRAQVFWHIQLPKIRPVLLMALLLRVIDSLMIYVEAFGINAGGPMGATAFLSLELGEEINAFNYGPAAARSVLYFLLVLSVAWLFRVAMQRETR